MLEWLLRVAVLRGYAYFFPGGLVPSDQEGWQSDKISKGGIIFTMDGEKADIIIRDALDRTKSVKEDGAIVEVLHVNPSAGLLKGTILIMVYYPAGALDHYLFQLQLLLLPIHPLHQLLKL